jgi:dTDP-4-amino-4,6-dideoxygalactose transaminase
MRVNLVDLKVQYETIKEEIDRAVMTVMENANFILGKQVDEFECKFAEFCGTRYSVGVGSGTDAIFLSLRALGIGEGDEVITTTNTFVATVLGISKAGAKPVLVDIEPDNYNIDPSKIKDAVTSKTRAIIPVHLYGKMSDMDSITTIAKKYNLKVVEDACQAHGASYNSKRAGSIGTLSCFSFYPAKNLGAYGDGGMIVMNDEHLYSKLKMLRDYGQSKKYYHDFEGYNSRLDTIQAAVLLVKLGYLDDWNEKRRKCARLYNELLANVDVVIPIEEEEFKHVYHLYVIRTVKRDEMINFLKSRDIYCGIHYPIPIHLQKAYKNLGYKNGDFPITEKYASQILSLPMFPELTEEQIYYVVDNIKEFLNKKPKNV